MPALHLLQSLHQLLSSSERLRHRVNASGFACAESNARSEAVSLNVGTLRFSRMCAALVAPGMTATPCESAQRSRTCALVQPWRSATLATLADAAVGPPSPALLLEPPSDP